MKCLIKSTNCDIIDPKKRFAVIITNQGEAVKTKAVFVSNVLLTCAVALFAVLFMATGNLLSKACASICFTVIGTINFIVTRNRLKEYRSASILLLWGLLAAMLGDILINHIFTAGVVMFAAAHILFFITQQQLCPLENRNRSRDIICAVGLFAVNISFLLLVMPQDKDVLTAVICALYAIIISMMTGKAISNFIGVRSRFFGYMLLGTGLFLLSDVTLVIYGFMGNNVLIHTVSSTMYYVSEVILADSYLILANKAQK